jgi:hypothetical protein
VLRVAGPFLDAAVTSGATGPGSHPGSIAVAMNAEGPDLTEQPVARVSSSDLGTPALAQEPWGWCKARTGARIEEWGKSQAGKLPEPNVYRPPGPESVFRSVGKKEKPVHSIRKGTVHRGG